MRTTNIFANLTASEYSELKESIPYITVLIAGADGHIDSQELNWAEKLTNIRSYAKPDLLNAYYDDVHQTFHHDLKTLIDHLPSDTSTREELIVQKLKNLNMILQHLENKVAYKMYMSLRSFAEQVAKSSGGFLRFATISSHERKWIDLPMVEPIVLLSDSEEE